MFNFGLSGGLPGSGNSVFTQGISSKQDFASVKPNFSSNDGSNDSIFSSSSVAGRGGTPNIYSTFQ